MAPQPKHNPEYLDPDHEAISTFADTYFDDEDERSAFVDTLMERRGYQRRTAWAPPPEPDPNETPKSNGQPAQRKPAYFKR